MRRRKDEIGENPKGLRPEAGKKGGEVTMTGHGPSTQENRETSNHGGKEKPRKKRRIARR